jgi:hypothetical protein
MNERNYSNTSAAARSKFNSVCFFYLLVCLAARIELIERCPHDNSAPQANNVDELSCGHEGLACHGPLQ